MPNYRRALAPGGTFFFTVNTFRRQPALTYPAVLSALHRAVRETQAALPFNVVAAVVLPDRLHVIWELPQGDPNFSLRWARIKQAVTRVYAALPVAQAPNTASRTKCREGTLWQRRFWGHQICNETDLVRHVEYIHYNPVKHGHVMRVRDWPHSTFHAYVRSGAYPTNWGDAEFTDTACEYGE